MKNKQNQFVYYGNINHKDWSIYIAATDKGLCFIGSPKEGINELRAWVDKNKSGATLTEDETKISPYAYQLKEYLDGKRKTFDIAVDLNGTIFQETVWNELQNIPYGEIVSYSDLANKIGKPKAVRAVGTANGANPVMIVVPCHRVVAKNGNLTGFRGGLEMKKALLALEKSNEMGE